MRTGFSAILGIGEISGERDAVALTYQADNGMVGPIRMEMPVHHLARTGFVQALSRRDSTGLGDAAFRYATLLRESISHALEHQVDAAPSASLLVLVGGPPHVHRWIWETLRVSEPHAGLPAPATVVVHAPATATADSKAEELLTGGTELTWIGARPDGTKDLPRFQVLGPVMNALAVSPSGIRFAAARSDANLREMEILLQPSTENAFRICHLDAHGTSRIQVATDDSLTDAEFSFKLRGDGGPVEVPDGMLLKALTDFGADMFTTNACFGAQQRGILEYPFPGLLVQRGIRLALAVREPLQGDAAAVFFHRFYGLLARGGTVLDAYAYAIEDLVKTPFQALSDRPVFVGAWDLAARWAVQPVVWTGNTADLWLRFADVSTDYEVPACHEYLYIARTGEWVSDLASVVEDNAWSGHSQTEVKAGEGCDLTTPLLRDLIAEVKRVLRPPVALPRDRLVLKANAQTVEMRQMAERERFVLIRERFKGSSALLGLLAQLLPGDVSYLDELASRAAGDATEALLHALSWGPSSIPVPSDHVDNADAYSEELAGLFIPHEGNVGPSGKISTDDLDKAMAQINIALPLLGINGSAVLAAPVPRFMNIGDAALKHFTALGLGFLNSDAHGVVFANAYPWTQLAARRNCLPEEIFVVRLIMSEHDSADEANRRDRELNESAGWNPGTRLSCLSWLAFAVAARQVGGCDYFAMRWAAQIIRKNDSAAALAIMRALHRGLRGWHQLKDPYKEWYSKEIAGVEEVDISSDAWLLNSDHTSNESARMLALFRADRMEDVLSATALLMNGFPQDTPPFGIVKARAYALARTGRVGEAWRTIAPLIPQLREMNTWDQCELLHLLGELMERQGRTSLTVRYMLQERALSPPSLDRRVHNRHHLYTALQATTPRDLRLAAMIAREGLDLAREARDNERTRFFADELALLACYTVNPAKLQNALDAIGNEPSLVTSPPIVLADALRQSLDKGGIGSDEDSLTTIKVLADGEDETAALACYLLGNMASISTEEKLALLHRGAAMTTSVLREPSIEGLFKAYWEQKDFINLKSCIEAYSTPGEVNPTARIASAAIAVADTRNAEAVKNIALAIALADFKSLMCSMPGFWESLSGELRAQAIDSAATLLACCAQSKVSEGEFQVEAELHSVTAVDALDRLAYIISFVTTPNRETRYLFEWVSDRAWDRGDLQTAAVAREHLCGMLARMGPAAAAERAEQISWLATIYKIRGRINEAESLYQQSIEIGGSCLEKSRLASIIERYGCLLHQIGDYEAALHVQWQGIRTMRPDLRLPSFPDSAATCREALTAEDIADGQQLAAWSLQVANLTACFISSKLNEFSKIGYTCASQALEAARVLLKSSDPGNNFRSASLLVERISQLLSYHEP